MCGIAGQVCPVAVRPEVSALAGALASLTHRGPDGDGLADLGTAAFGHRRLSIIDLAGSAQPWFDGDGRYCLIFNGEIYNYLELRAELLVRGRRFVSEGDTEVLAALLIEQGPAALGRLNGMFALAWWDRVERTLLLARDRLGKKPLFLAEYRGGLVFASELDALRAWRGLDLELDPAALDQFFAYQFIPGERTIYRGVRKLLPGHYLRWQDGRSRLERFWSMPQPQRTRLDEADLAQELVVLVRDSVRLRLRSDVPVGAFLSGGIDSAIIVAALAELGADLECFTVGFTPDSFDESSAAHETARALGVCHRVERLDLDLTAIVPICAAAFGEPYADASALPTWLLCQAARRRVTVAISGDGADELFGGYRRYQAASWVATYLRLPSVLRRRVIATLARRLPEGEGYFGSSPIKKLKLFLHLAKRLAECPNDRLPQTFTAGERSALFAPGLTAACSDHVDAFGLAGLDLPEQMIQTDLHTYLPEDILTKVDRMGMAHALEVRCPFLDYRVVEFAARLPLEFKIRGRVQKYLLRRAFGARLPPTLMQRPKHGFAVPVGAALRGALAPLFVSQVLDAPVSPWLRREEVVRLWQEHGRGRTDHGFKLWSILMFYLWYGNSVSTGRRGY